MLHFIIPLQSPEVSTDWDKVSALVVRTLHSVMQQTHPAFHAILVCNQRPDGLPRYKQLTVIEEPFPIPQVRQERMRDKWTKVRRGLIAVRNTRTTHVMIVDADDLVNCRLTAHVAHHPKNRSGWLIPRGYVHEEGSCFLLRHDALNTICGSTGIIRIEPKELPRSMKSPESHFVLEHGHSAIADFMKRTGRPLDNLPFPGAVYISGTGENDSSISVSFRAGRRHFLRSLLRFRMVTPRIRKEFNLYPLRTR